MEFNAVLVRLGEYMVRGSAFRERMVRRLIESIDYFLEKNGFSKYSIKEVDSRVVIEDIEGPVKAAEIVSRVFGVSSTSPVFLVRDRVSRIGVYVREFVREHLSPKDSFKIDVSCSIKGISCYGLARYLGYIVHGETGSIVNLSNPDKTIYVDIRGDYLMISDRLYEGVGGLPYGVEGCLVSLVSGGVDSAVASWLAMKRGCSLVPVYIDMGSYWSVEARKRALESIELLWKTTPWNYMRAYIVHEVHDIIASADIPSRLRCVFCKTVMHKVASIIAEREGCLGAVSGESIGQVASQTLSNLYAINRVANSIVYRPVCFLDKLEIVKLAHRIGFSVLDRDVGKCSLRPLHPKTSISLKDIELLSKTLDKYLGDIVAIIDRNSELLEYRL